MNPPSKRSSQKRRQTVAFQSIGKSGPIAPPSNAGMRWLYSVVRPTGPSTIPAAPVSCGRSTAGGATLGCDGFIRLCAQPAPRLFRQRRSRVGDQRREEQRWDAMALFGCAPNRPLDYSGSAGLVWAINGGRSNAGMRWLYSVVRPTGPSTIPAAPVSCGRSTAGGATLGCDGFIRLCAQPAPRLFRQRRSRVGDQRREEQRWDAMALFGCAPNRPLDYSGSAGLVWAINGGRLPSYIEIGQSSTSQ